MDRLRGALLRREEMRRIRVAHGALEGAPGRPNDVAALVAPVADLPHLFRHLAQSLVHLFVGARSLAEEPPNGSDNAPLVFGYICTLRPSPVFDIEREAETKRALPHGAHDLKTPHLITIAKPE